MAQANTSESTNAAHHDQFASPHEFHSPEQFDALKKEYTRHYERCNAVTLKCDIGCQTEVFSGSPEDGELGATALEPPTQDKENVDILKIALESKDALISELEQKTHNLTRESEDMKKQVKEANERTRIAELEGEESIQMRNAFFLQTTRQNDQLQQNESEINCLRREIEDLHAKKDIMFIL
ncbi:Hypothetical predicted protein [Paramuricea clavata]|uniref:Uncharacterized protein n=1 Tax=Paramuricea clavata TaxID=317549 RepID=A0A6S7JJ84_PARCT|nr:Hypothetical predicted protein [Paramuricea clavata]